MYNMSKCGAVTIQLNTVPLNAYETKDLTVTTREIVNFDPDTPKNMSMTFLEPTSSTSAVQTDNRLGYHSYIIYMYLSGSV